MGRGLYLVDKDGWEYGFNADMAKHTNLYAVMRDGVHVPWQGSLSLKAPEGNVAPVLAGDRRPTEAELLAARDLVARHDSGQSEQIALAAQAAQAARAAAAATATNGSDEPELPYVASDIRDYRADQGAAIPPTPPVPRRVVPPPPTRTT